MIGWQETILILVILLVVFGPTKLPKLARDLGKTWHEFNKASSGVIEAAKKLGIRTEGKDTAQILKEMNAQLAETKA